MCGISLALRYFIAAISTRLYYDIELWLTLSGAILFYGIISFIGYAYNSDRLSLVLRPEGIELIDAVFFIFRLIAMYFILPETEKRSLEDIELHYADETKKITDIHIRINNVDSRNKEKTLD